MIQKHLLDNFDMNVNFWEVEPQFKAAGPFKILYEEDKTKKKKPSSTLMWFIALCYDMGSRWRKLDPIDKHTIIGEDFCGDIQFFEKNKDTIVPCIDMYVNMQDTESQKSLREWEEGMRNRRQFLSDTPYSVDAYKMIEDMRKNTKALYADLARIKKELESEADEGRAKGGKQLSMSDSGDLDD
jgi:hypothetical protein